LYVGLFKSPEQGQHILIQLDSLGGQHEQHPPLRNRFSAKYFNIKNRKQILLKIKNGLKKVNLGLRLLV
jgi:hypothetical protein